MKKEKGTIQIESTLKYHFSGRKLCIATIWQAVLPHYFAVLHKKKKNIFYSMFSVDNQTEPDWVERKHTNIYELNIAKRCTRANIYRI